MCDFCKVESNGDRADDCKNLLDKDYDFPTKFEVNEGSLHMEVKSEINYSVLLGLYPGFYKDDDHLWLTIWRSDDDFDNGVNEGISINYCPMCGRKLTRSMLEVNTDDN